MEESISPLAISGSRKEPGLVSMKGGRSPSATNIHDGNAVVFAWIPQLSF